MTYSFAKGSVVKLGRCEQVGYNNSSENYVKGGKRMATIRDIAKLAGYSVSTVSRVLNNHPYVSDEKRQKIQQIIDEQHYIPNTKARHLSYGKSLNIGVMIPLTNNSWFEQMTSGIVDEAAKAGYTVTLLPTNYDIEREEQLLTELLAKAYDGLIILSRASSLETIEGYAKEAPVVCCEDTHDFDISSVYIERKRMYKEVFEQIKAEGKTPVGLTLSRNERKSASMRTTVESFCEVFGSLDEAVIVRECRTFEEGLEAGAYFASQKRPPKVVFANGDEVAAGIYEYYQKGQGIEIIGQGNELLSRVLNFPTILHPLKEMGRIAFRRLFDDKISKTQLNSQWVNR